MGNIFKIYDAFPRKKEAVLFGKDLRKLGVSSKVRKLRKPQDGGRLKYGIYTNDKRYV